MSDKKRMAGDALYGGVDNYGEWGETWNADAAQQQLKASGSYNAESDLAKQFEGLNKDGKSRVDDDEGWRELVFDEDAKGAGNYQDLVNKWSKAGFDVRAIDMNGDFANSNIAVRKSTGAGTGVENPFGDDAVPGGSQTIEADAPNQTIENNTPAPAPGTGIRESQLGSMTQNVIQDNDIYSNVSGNNNTVTNTQDNSVRQYGGSRFKDMWMKDYFS